MRVLLTGATGLIGRETARALAADGHEVVALSRAGGPVDGAAERRAADLLDPSAARAAVAGAEALVHLAWHSGPGRMAAPENLAWAGATLRLVHDFADAGGRRVVGAGSCAEYDWSARSHHAEDDRLGPRSLYGATKARTGQLLCEAAPHLGLSAAWARIFFSYGAGEPQGRLVGDLIAGLRAGREVPCTDGTQRRDFMSAADIGRALALLVASDVAGPVNVATGEAVAVARLVRHVANRIGRPELVRLGAIERPADDPACVEADVGRLAGLGFRPRLTFEAGLDDAIGRTG